MVVHGLLYRMFSFKSKYHFSDICDINITRQTSCFFRFYLLGTSYRTALQQMHKMSTTFTKTSIQLSGYFVRLQEAFCTSVGNRMFNIVFQFRCASWSILINSFLRNHHRKKCLCMQHVRTCTVSAQLA